MPVSYVPQPILTIDNEPAPESLKNDLLQVSVEESLDLPGMFTLVIKNDYFSGRQQDKPWQYEKLFAIGKPIKIGFQSSTTKAVEFEDENKGDVLEGEITAIETHFTGQSQAPIVIRGYDVAHRLHRGRYNRSFQNMKDSDIVKKIAGEVGITTGTIDESGGPYGYSDINGSNGYVFQENQTNMEFLRERAARHGFELFVQDGKLNFRKPKSTESLALKWLKDIHSFRVRVTSAEQVDTVEVRGWDYSQKRAIESTKNSAQVLTETEYGKGKATNSAFSGKPPTPKMLVVNKPIFAPDEADKIAQALVDELGGEFVHADAKGEGNPKIRPSKIVQLSDLGKYSGKYYITATRHLYHEGVYTTEFSVRGLRGGDLLSVLSPKTYLQPGQTLLAGIVTDNNDPKGWGRVRVMFPTLTPSSGPDAHTSYWARVLGTGAGPGRGFDCLPEINDEVLVAFEHGDINRPYVIAGVWNGKDLPPEKVTDSVTNGKVRLRTFKTRTGHTLQFVEDDKDRSKKGVYLKTTAGHNLRLNDSEKFVEVETEGSHKLRLDDSNKTISITSTGDITIKTGTTGLSKKISVNAGEIALTATQKITLSVGGNKIEVAMSGITISATGPVTVQGLPIKLN